ncbi:hypothetical protein Ddye_021013 [Dipteronia dyeriana]|uniref:RNase H type-1 domain-containing protein n=1 Tax=Dipteronia dyeriana TaxID=168575 RepID=A0AAD9U1L9_9ROSI|nr:hypothetical protein Ddye_021013 [Dipteronia dyeriana]
MMMIDLLKEEDGGLVDLWWPGSGRLVVVKWWVNEWGLREREREMEVFYYFSIPLKHVFTFEAELWVVIHAIAWKFNWNLLWLDSDSTYVVNLLLHRSIKVPWHLLQAWMRCLFLIDSMDFHVSHIYREDNLVMSLKPFVKKNLPKTNVRDVLRKIWWVKEVAETELVSNNIFSFQFKNAENRCRILAGGQWTFDGALIVMEKPTS